MALRAILVRIGVDSSYGGWNAPVDPDSREFVYVPIPEGPKSEFDQGLARPFSEMQSSLDRFAAARSMQIERDFKYPHKLRDRTMHLDPDFEHLTYGDDGAARGSEIKSLAIGDLLIFYSGMRPIRPCSHRLIYALERFSFGYSALVH